MRDLVTMVREWLRGPIPPPAVEQEHELVTARVQEHEKVISLLERTVALRKSASAAGRRMAR